MLIFPLWSTNSFSPFLIKDTEKLISFFTKKGIVKRTALNEFSNIRTNGVRAIVLDEEKVINPDGLRFDDEFVRHKILDAIGDLRLLGYPYIASYKSYAGSHNLNHELTKKLFDNPSSYEIVELEGIKDIVFYDQH